MLDFGVLGPLEISCAGRSVRLPGAASRRVLAALVLRVGEWQSVDRLSDGLWGEQPPRLARKALQMHVSRVRAALAAAAPESAQVLVRGPGGYRLAVDEEQVDAARFGRLLEQGRRALAEGDPRGARELLERALGLWRGAPLAELALDGAFAAELGRLEELRLVALEQWIAALLELGLVDAAIGELRRLVVEHPWRERLHAQLMLALYRGGRQAEALDAFQRARGVLVEQLGIEPGAELRERHHAILTQELTLNHAPARTDSAELDPGSLPTPRRLFGREHDVDQLARLVQEDDARLVTVVGTGGVGKSALVVTTAHRLQGAFREGVRFVSLASLTDPAELAATIALALGAVPVEGESSRQALRRFLANRQLLLVLDNFEHLIAEARLVGELLDHCLQIRVLVTSREPTRLFAERVFRLASLPVPPLADAADVAQQPTMALFVERARAADTAFELDDAGTVAVAEICRRLEGLPLAIELAAARVPLFAPRELARRLDRALSILGGGARDAPARHQTLRATLDWSYTLLDHAERRTFAAFGVFARGATIDSCEQVTDADVQALASLVDKSLLLRAGDRLIALEPVRQYAAEHLDRLEDAGELHRRHARWCLELATSSQQQLRGPDRRAALSRMDANIDELHAALHWTFARGEPALPAALAVAIAPYWATRAQGREGLCWIDRALHSTLATIERAHALYAQALLRYTIEDFHGARHSANAAADLAQTTNDPHHTASALLIVARCEEMLENAPAARHHAQQALTAARALADELLQADALCALATMLPSAGARALFDRATQHYRAAGDQHALAATLSSAAYGELLNGNPIAAAAFLDEADSVEHGLDDKLLRCTIRGNQALAALLAGDHTRANTTFRETLATARELGLNSNAGQALAGFHIRHAPKSAVLEAFNT